MSSLALIISLSLPFRILQAAVFSFLFSDYVLTSVLCSRGNRNDNVSAQEDEVNLAGVIYDCSALESDWPMGTASMGNKNVS